MSSICVFETVVDRILFSEIHDILKLTILVTFYKATAYGEECCFQKNTLMLK